jgi:hypothetical protein
MTQINTSKQEKEIISGVTVLWQWQTDPFNMERWYTGVIVWPNGEITIKSATNDKEAHAMVTSSIEQHQATLRHLDGLKLAQWQKGT